MKRQSNLRILLRMLVLVKPLTGFMILAVVMGTLGFLTAQFIPITGGMAVLSGLGIIDQISIKALFGILLVLALSRAISAISL